LKLMHQYVLNNNIRSEYRPEEGEILNV